MIAKTSGIVLSYIKYKETSIIARLFTLEYGYGSFIINAVRSRRSRKSIGLFQPFFILDLVLYLKDSREIQRISDFSNRIPLHSLHQNLYSSSIALFLSEILSGILKQESHKNEGLYQFLEDSIASLDAIQNPANFHIQFLLKLGSFLGFAISDFETLIRSTDKPIPITGHHTFFESLVNDPYGSTLEISRDVRNQLLDLIIDYYLHHSELSRPKSLEVLRKVLE